MERFAKEFIDEKLSPYTGMTRKSWIAAAKYLLRGIFENLEDKDAPIVMKREETDVTYPHKNVSEKRADSERRAEIFEGLARSFFIAAPIIKEEPNICIGGICLADYYKEHVLRACTRGDEQSVGFFDELCVENAGNPFATYQQTVETAALVICLKTSEDAIWKKYTTEERDQIASFISGFAHAATVPQNWRMFNMLDLAFLHMNGYKIDKSIMLDHAEAILQYYVGDGWYRDGQSFDYYSCWAFNVYAPIWNRWYGYENEPYIAKRFEENSNKLMETYMDFFDRDGYVNMWGRSCIYRNAASSALAANFLFNDPKADPGRARRIMSGALLQFIDRDDFLSNGIPALGFYRIFMPLVQGYSCAESPFWLGKAFLCLELPENHPFWTATENEGTWGKIKEGEVKETVLNGPALLFSNHEKNGETILRSGKVVKTADNINGIWNYGKLCYNTKYPWEATPTDLDKKLEVGIKVESQQYILHDVTTNKNLYGNATFWCGVRKEVLYRRQFFNYNLETEMHWIQAIDLADFAVPYGIMRADRLKIHRRPIKITLGAYGMPDNDVTVNSYEENGFKAVVVKGKNSQGKPRCIAMTVFEGFSNIDLVRSTGTNPDSVNSIVIYANAIREKQYCADEPYMLVSQVITRDDGQDFSLDDLFPISKIEHSDASETGAYGATKIKFKNGSEKEIFFEGIEAGLTI